MPCAKVTSYPILSFFYILEDGVLLKSKFMTLYTLLADDIQILCSPLLRTNDEWARYLCSYVVLVNANAAGHRMNCQHSADWKSGGKVLPRHIVHMVATPRSQSHS